MATNAGGGYSRWKDLAVTRWREDATCDGWGTFCYLRDAATGALWSSAYQPTRRPSKKYEAIFVQGRAEYRRRDEDIDAHTEIAVSPEDDVEVRRVTLTNLSPQTRTIELTSYAEVVLAPPERRPCAPGLQQSVRADRDSPRLAGHSVHAPSARARREAAMDVPSDDHARHRRRATRPTKQTGPRSSVAAAPSPTRLAFDELAPLSNTDGAVLDPIVAIRQGVVIESDTSANWHIISGVAETRAAALALIAKYRDPSFAARAFEMAWSHSQTRAAPGADDRSRGPVV